MDAKFLEESKESLSDEDSDDGKPVAEFRFLPGGQFTVVCECPYQVLELSSEGEGSMIMMHLNQTGGGSTFST